MAENTTTTTGRKCWHADESFVDPGTGLFRLIEIDEDEPGYRTLMSYADLAVARQVARDLNAEAGLSQDDVLHIRASSMAAHMAAKYGDLSHGDVGENHRGSTIGNGIPYFAYYRPEEALAFEWTGNPFDPVEVAQGGAGEPIVARFPITLGAAAPLALTQAFAARCDLWTQENGEDL